MLPIILVSHDLKYIESYIDKTIKEHSIPAASISRYHPESTVITIDQIREINVHVQTMYEPHLIVVYNFDTAKKESQNALLKTLEEGSTTAYFILVVRDESDVLPTIQSRSRISYHTDTKEIGTKLLDKYGFLESGVNLPQWMGKTAKLKKEQAEPLIDEIIGFLHGNLSAKSARSVSHILETRQYVQKNNLNFEYALDDIGTILDQAGLLPLHD